MFYNYGHKSLVEGRTNVKINNKKSHFKKILTSLRMIYIPASYLSEFDRIITLRGIKVDEVDINLIKWFLGTYNVKNTIVSFIMLNLVKNQRQSLDSSELETACDIFNEFIIFVHNLYPNFTVRYDFFIDKVLRFNNVNLCFKPRNYKDISRKNIYQIIWDRFLIHLNKKMKSTFKTLIPLHVYHNQDDGEIVD